MAKLEFVPVQPWHAEFVAGQMRAVDRMEVWSLHRMTPAQALQSSLRAPGDAWTVMIDDEPAAIFGVVALSLVGGSGIGWMLGTPWLDQHWRLVVRQSKPLLAELQGRWPSITNTVHIDNRRTLKWLQWLGAMLDEQDDQVRFELCAR